MVSLAAVLGVILMAGGFLMALGAWIDAEPALLLAGVVMAWLGYGLSRWIDGQRKVRPRS
jgi:hypothetical protein